MVVGIGSPVSAVTQTVPTFMLGFELTPIRSTMAFRLAGEYARSERYVQESSSNQRVVGLQVLGIRAFGRHRMRPYLLAGFGLYDSRWNYTGPTWALTDSGFTMTGPIRSSRGSEVVPTLIWGAGHTVRVRSVTFFGELKLPWYMGSRLEFGPHAPLVLGIKF